MYFSLFVMFYAFVAVVTFFGLGFILILLRRDDEPDWHDILICSLVTTVVSVVGLFFLAGQWSLVHLALWLGAMAISIRTLAPLSWQRLIIAVLTSTGLSVAVAVLLPGYLISLL